MSTFPGLRLALEEPLFPEEVLDEEDAEVEATRAMWAPNNYGDQGQVGTPPMIRPTTWMRALDGASTGVTQHTEQEYTRLMKAFEAWAKAKRYIASNVEVFTEQVLPEMPDYISMWILDTCDEISLDGSARLPHERRCTYSHGMKMRAAMTYGFGRLPSIGNLPWHKTDSGTWRGNPSISNRVSRYMLSLHRRKVRGGEAPQSARAITPEILCRLWHFNHRAENWTVDDYRPSRARSRQDTSANWGGGNTRRLLESAYTIAFWCLLRFDEVTQIQMSHITPLSKTSFMLTLPFRKTHQCGSIPPFYLHLRPVHEAYMCPVRALACWINASNPKGGYLYPPMRVGDRIGSVDQHISTEKFLELFRNNLLDVGIDPHPYGTHSFRRGGCQWLASGLRWPLRRICDWGGWSLNFTHMTIVKYLISWNDDPSEPREDYLNPDRAPASQCYACGRRCHCG